MVGIRAVSYTHLDVYKRQLKGQEVNGKFDFEGKNKATAINRFLYQQGVFGGDSLMKRPLMQKVSTDIYTKLMQDLAEEGWERYKATQDTSDRGQNAFVRAALEAQYYELSLIHI